MIGNYKCHKVFDHTMSTAFKIKVQTLADPGFPVGGERKPCGGVLPMSNILFAENVCENERIGSRSGGGEISRSSIDKDFTEPSPPRPSSDLWN